MSGRYSMARVSRDKLCEAGYKLLRRSEVTEANVTFPAIMVSEGGENWHIYGKYATNKERDLMIYRLLFAPNSKYIYERI